uniref:flippase n=1 Tax=Phocaeicola vulgatus TaxID=821 RepID=UPI004026081F
MSSIKNNVVLNYINTLASIVFPLITFPYAARILLPEGIGLVNFQNSIIGYITLLSSLGIPLYAVREVARVRDNIEERNRVTVEIALLSLILAAGGYVIVFAVGELVPQIYAHLSLFYILSLSILFTALGVSWFYTAIEDFKFITIRGLIIRCLFVVALFVFVRSKDDLLIYGVVVVGSTVGNNIINFFHLRKFINIFKIDWSKLNIFRHLKPSLSIFVLNLSISLYVQLNPVMLGFLSDNIQVGYFTAGSKLSNIILSVVTSMATVLIPHVSNMIQVHDTEKYKQLITKVYHYYMALAIPFTIGLIVLSVPLTLVICGKSFYDASYVTAITAPVIIFISITNIIGMQVLYPYGKENYVTYSTIGGAVINLVVDIPLILLWGSKGAAISTVCAEFTVLLIQVRLGKGYVPFKYIDKNIILYSVSAVIMGIVVFLVRGLFENPIIQLLVPTFIGIVIYSFILYYKKEDILFSILRYIHVIK